VSAPPPGCKPAGAPWPLITVHVVVDVDLDAVVDLDVNLDLDLVDPR
jgi:hypothetical protein